MISKCKHGNREIIGGCRECYKEGLSINLNKKDLIKKIKHKWKAAKKKGEDTFDEIDELIDNENLTEYQRGYYSAKLEEIGNSLSSEEEDWLWEVISVIENLPER